MKAFVRKFLGKVESLLENDSDYFAVHKKLFELFGMAMDVRGPKYEVYRRLSWTLVVLYIFSMILGLILSLQELSFSEITQTFALSAMISIGMMRIILQVKK
jgi:hypothetical protein